SLADMVSAISELRAGLISIDKRLSDPRGLIPPEMMEVLSLQSVRASHRSRAAMHEMRMMVDKMKHVLMDKRSAGKGDEVLRDMMVRLEMLTDRMCIDD
ncbi:MAG: hypothetical protein ABIJ00_03620, partial [Candidatus Eisenbacteria bacterium]